MVPSDEFDEIGYLLMNRDVADAVASGQLESGYEHYERYGRAEGRSLFDSALYRRRYPDVDRSIARGDFRSASEHFARFGRFEGRSIEPPQPEQSRLLKTFCSLGPDCEFGFVQLYFDAPALDIMRFAASSSDTLNRLLENRFRNFGLSRSLLASVVDGEWMMTDTVYGLRWHTYASEEVGKDDIIKRESVRVSYLARKVKAELEQANRIFVRSGSSDQSDDGYHLADSLKKFNASNRLLWVTAGDQKVGQVETLNPGLVHGYLKEFWTITPDVGTRIDYFGWLELCNQAARIFAEGNCTEFQVLRTSDGEHKR